MIKIPNKSKTNLQNHPIYTQIPKYPNTQISPNLPSRSLSLREDSVFLPKAPNPIPENNIKPVFFASSTPVHPPLPNQLVTDLNL